MILIRLMGGLGNQMFQYAFGRRMAIACNTELVLDQSLLLDRSQPHELVTHRNFALDIFNLQPYRWASEEEVFLYNGAINASAVSKFCRIIKNKIAPKKLVIQKANEINVEYFFLKPSICFVGRWQSELYFKDAAKQIKNEFTIKYQLNDEIKKYQDIINSCNAVCLHVRRADLITSTAYSKSIGVLNWSYYENALTYIREKVINPVFFVFSDDIEWCTKNIILPEKTYFMNDLTAGIKAEGHLFLMQKCKHFIISNSTYAWWGAWLSDELDKQVVYPAKWYSDITNSNPQMCPSTWKAL